MKDISLCIGEPFISPAWGSNLVVFSSPSGEPIPEITSKQYIAKACDYAKKYEVYLVPERFILQDTQCMCLIAPSGNVMGAQKALFNNGSIAFGREKGSTLDVISTELGGIYLCVDVDVYRPEVAKIVFNMGAQLVICSQYFAPMQYSEHRIISGVWDMAQSNNMIVIGTSSEYNAVCAPREITKYDDGFIESPTMRMPVTAKFSLDSLVQLPPKPLLGRRLYAFHRRELIGAEPGLDTE